MGNIFISYSHKDSSYIHRLEKALKKRGFDVWIDKRIDYGSVWPRIIQKYLDECEAFIVVVSENSFESEWVQKEVTRAQRIKKPFFPLLLSGDPWISIETTQYVDVRGEVLPPPKFYNRLSSVLSKHENMLTHQGFDSKSAQPKRASSISERRKHSKSTVHGGINIKGNVIIRNSKVAGRDFVEKNIPNINSSFASVYKAIKQSPNVSLTTKESIETNVRQIEDEIKKGKKMNSSFITARLINLQEMAPAIFKLVVMTLQDDEIGFDL
jgi:hypothetical protein